MKCTSDVDFTRSFLEIVFGRYFKQVMGKKMTPKMFNESEVASFARKSHPQCQVIFLKMIVWRVKSRYLYDNIMHFIHIIRRNYTRSYDIQSFSYPYVGVIFDKSILSRSQKLADADPTGTLDSCSGTQN